MTDSDSDSAGSPQPQPQPQPQRQPQPEAEADSADAATLFTAAELSACIGLGPSGVAITAIPKFFGLPFGDEFQTAVPHGLASLYARGLVDLTSGAPQLVDDAAATAMMLAEPITIARFLVVRDDATTARLVVASPHGSLVGAPAPFDTWQLSVIGAPAPGGSAIIEAWVREGLALDDLTAVTLEVGVRGDPQVEMVLAEREESGTLRLRHGLWTPLPTGGTTVDADEQLGAVDDDEAIATLLDLLTVDAERGAR